MGVFYDNITDTLYTCSEDKYIKTIENKDCTNGKLYYFWSKILEILNNLI